MERRRSAIQVASLHVLVLTLVPEYNNRIRFGNNCALGVCYQNGRQAATRGEIGRLPCSTSIDTLLTPGSVNWICRWSFVQHGGAY